MARRCATSIESLPRDELFQSSTEQLLRTSISILGVMRTWPQQAVPAPRPLWPAILFSALVYIPRDRFNTEARSRIETLLTDALHGERGRHHDPRSANCRSGR